jgi:cephalosporin hydroxylase
MNIYHEQLSNLKNRDAVLLELGVAAGESLKYWCDYLPKARIVGIDIQPVQIDDPTGRIRFYTGEQQDRAMLDKIAAAEAPEGFDVIIDDASHMGQFTRISFWHLFKNHLKPGGLYFIEDWGVAYWPTNYYDGKKYVPKPVDFSRVEKFLDWVGKISFVHKNAFLRRVARYLYRKGCQRVFTSHEYGMVGVLKELVDECGAPDMTDDRFGLGPKRASMIEWMRISVGMALVKKSTARIDV